jgi:hypothetical protein
MPICSVCQFELHYAIGLADKWTFTEDYYWDMGIMEKEAYIKSIEVHQSRARTRARVCVCVHPEMCLCLYVCTYVFTCACMI